MIDVIVISTLILLGVLFSIGMIMLPAALEEINPPAEKPNYNFEFNHTI